MKFSNAVATGFFIMGVAAIRSSSVLVPGLDLEVLCRDAEVIVVGRAVRVVDAGPVNRLACGTAVHGRVKTATVEAATFIKGDAPKNGLVVTFFLPDSFLGYRGIPAGRFGVFFLTKTTRGFEPADPYHPFVVATPGGPRACGSALDDVIAELAHAASDLRADEETRREAVMALEFVRSPSATSALKRATSDPTQDVGLRAMAALLRRNDMSQMAAAEAILARDNSSADEHTLSLISGLANAISVGVNDPRSIPSLARLLKSRNTVARRAAVAAIRRAGGNKAVGFLVESVDDSDAEVAWTAILGLAEITGDLDHGPGALAQFTGKQREQYVNYWRDWAKSQK